MAYRTPTNKKENVVIYLIIDTVVETDRRISIKEIGISSPFLGDENSLMSARCDSIHNKMRDWSSFENSRNWWDRNENTERCLRENRQYVKKMNKKHTLDCYVILIIYMSMNAVILRKMEELWWDILAIINKRLVHVKERKKILRFLWCYKMHSSHSIES